MICEQKALFGLRLPRFTVYVKCTHFAFTLRQEARESTMFPRANSVYIIEDHSVDLNMGGTGIENIDFENTT